MFCGPPPNQSRIVVNDDVGPDSIKQTSIKVPADGTVACCSEYLGIVYLDVVDSRRVSIKALRSFAVKMMEFDDMEEVVRGLTVIRLLLDRLHN